MNIQDIFNSPEKQWVDVNFHVINVGQSKPGKFDQIEQSVGIKDESGQVDKLKIQTKYESGLLDNSDANQQLPFKVKWVQFRDGPQLIGYTTKPRQMGDTASQTGNTPPLGSTAPQPALTAPQPAQGPDWDAIAEGKVRCNILSAAIQSGQIICKTKEDVVKYTAFVMGKGEPPATQSGPQDWEDPEKPY